MSPEEKDLRFCTDRKTPLLSLTNLRKRGENNIISGRRKCTLASQGANWLLISETRIYSIRGQCYT